MKRKILLGLAFFTVVFLVSGVFIAYTIRSATGDLDRLIALHQVELLREQSLIQIKRVQSGMLLEGTPHPKSPEGVLADVEAMQSLVGTCFRCHHSQQATDRLTALQRESEAYHDASARALALRQQSAVRVDEERAAIQLGERLVARVRDMTDETATALQGRTRRVLHDIARTRYVLYALLGVGPVLAALLGFVFATGLTRPVNVLLESTRKLKAGHLDHRVSGLKDEFGELEVSFNEMASSLREQMHKMQRTEQMAVAGQLAAGLAHEIKNPLGGIKVAMQVLSEEGHLPQADRRVLRSVMQEVGRVESLMAQFLSFTRPPKPRLAELNVNDVVDTTVALHTVTRSTEGHPHAAIRVVKNLHPVPDTLGDPVQVQQVVLNLLLNAVDSMPNGGELEIETSLGERGDAVHIVVSDTGRGIKPEDAEKLFQPFFTTKAKGTGLGLATSKQLIEQHGGSITVAPNPGGGTRFRVQLPVRTTRATAA